MGLIDVYAGRMDGWMIEPTIGYLWSSRARPGDGLLIRHLFAMLFIPSTLNSCKYSILVFASKYSRF